MINKCIICKKEHYLRPAHYKRGRRCCSRKCGFIFRKDRVGKDHHMWKGDKVGYGGLHDWVKRNKPKTDLCECCNKIPPIDLANISGKYKRDISDFEWLCRKCHMIKDGRINNLKPPKRRGKIVKCKSCNKEIYKSQSLIKKKNFCSNKCVGLFNRNKPNKNRK